MDILVAELGDRVVKVHSGQFSLNRNNTKLYVRRVFIKNNSKDFGSQGDHGLATRDREGAKHGLVRVKGGDYLATEAKQLRKLPKDAGTLQVTLCVRS